MKCKHKQNDIPAAHQAANIIKLRKIIFIVYILGILILGVSSEKSVKHNQHLPQFQ